MIRTRSPPHHEPVCRVASDECESKQARYDGDEPLVALEKPYQKPGPEEIYNKTYFNPLTRNVNIHAPQTCHPISTRNTL
jgi:hypothetical protein